MQLEIIDHPSEWDRFVMQHPDAAFTHLFGWGRVIASVYRHKPGLPGCRGKGQNSGPDSPVPLQPAILSL